LRQLAVVRFLFGSVVAVLACGLTLASSSAQSQAAPRLVQAADGTLYLVTDEGRLLIQPAPISDEELAVLPDLGATDEFLPSLAPSPEVVREVVTIVVTPTPAPTPQPAQAAITLSADGAQNTRPFTLQGGNYVASWRAARHAADPTPCVHAASLSSTVRSGFSSSVPAFTDPIGGVRTISQGPASGESQIYGVPPGEYFVDYSGSCEWAITITPLR
jgi:hypothetical protein